MMECGGFSTTEPTHLAPTQSELKELKEPSFSSTASLP